MLKSFAIKILSAICMCGPTYATVETPKAAHPTAGTQLKKPATALEKKVVYQAIKGSQGKETPIERRIRQLKRNLERSKKRAERYHAALEKYKASNRIKDERLKKLEEEHRKTLNNLDDQKIVAIEKYLQALESLN